MRRCEQNLLRDETMLEFRHRAILLYLMLLPVTTSATRGKYNDDTSGQRESADHVKAGYKDGNVSKKEAIGVQTPGNASFNSYFQIFDRKRRGHRNITYRYDVYDSWEAQIGPTESFDPTDTHEVSHQVPGSEDNEGLTRIVVSVCQYPSLRDSDYPRTQLSVCVRGADFSSSIPAQSITLALHEHTFK
ncbi:hypothetical protein Btru_050083 [Bulinus truncatus]|nr:hypothetical protein Btru_050083 [Bulinus truncatus]